MSKHSRLTPGPDQPPRKVRGPSLVERAADRFDFAAAVRGPVVPERLAEPAAAPPPGATRPRPRGRAGRVSLTGLADGGFIVPGAAPAALAEEMRVIKRQLLGHADDAAARSILVCSARPGEGKTFCAINLALSLAAERDLEVVLVDADVHKPQLVATLGLEGGPGLLDAIADERLDVESCLIHTDVARLAVLPAGDPSHDATELLASKRTRAVLDRLRGADPRRVILFDSPPALAASPAGVLAMHCGQAVVVVRAERTGEADVREALSLLSACPRPQLLLNGVEFGAGARRFGQYYGPEA